MYVPGLIHTPTVPVVRTVVVKGSGQKEPGPPFWPGVAQLE